MNSGHLAAKSEMGYVDLPAPTAAPPTPNHDNLAAFSTKQDTLVHVVASIDGLIVCTRVRRRCDPNASMSPVSSRCPTNVTWLWVHENLPGTSVSHRPPVKR